jgi:hypothetical protein
MLSPFKKLLALISSIALAANLWASFGSQLAAQTMDLAPKHVPAITSEHLTALDTARLALPNLATDKNASSTPREIAWVFKVHPFQALLRGSYFLVAERFFNDNQLALSLGLGITRNHLGIFYSRDDFDDPSDSQEFWTLNRYYSGQVRIKTGFYSQGSVKYYLKAHYTGRRKGATYVGLFNVLRTYHWHSRLAYTVDFYGLRLPVESEHNNNVLEWQSVPMIGRSWVKSEGFFIEMFVGLGLVYYYNDYDYLPWTILSPVTKERVFGSEINFMPRMSLAMGFATFKL